MENTASVSLRELLEAGAHFGHQKSRWDPRMRPYIFGVRGGVYIIDLQKTVVLFREATDFLRDLAALGKTILFVGTKRQAQEIVAGGREAGSRLQKEIEGKAREEGEAILTRAKAEIEREKDAAVDVLRRESVDLALAAASKLLHQKLDGDQDRKLVMDFVDGLSTEKPGAEA